MGGTVERVKKGKGKKAKLKDVVKGRFEGCGVWYFSYLPEGPKPRLTKGYFYKKTKRGAKRRYARWSFDHLIYFFFNPGNNCKTYAFMQFVQRTAKRLTFKGTKYTEGAVIPAHSHGWQPDLEDWNKRTTKGFIDPTELLYKLQRGVKDKGMKKTRKHGAWGIERRDGPGYDYPVTGPKPANMKISYKFKVAAVCDVETDMKVLGWVEYGFSIVIDPKGNPTLEFAKPNIWENFTVTTICCKKSDVFDKWINQWRIYLLMGPPWIEPKKPEKAESEKKKKEKEEIKKKIIRLEDTGKVLDKAVKNRKRSLRMKK